MDMSYHSPSTTVYMRQNLCDNTLDNAHLETRCPLDNGRHDKVLQRFNAGQLDQLPTEILIEVLLCIDIPTLTNFRRVNRRSMDLVDSISQYAAIIKHCPNIIRAVVSIQASAYSCNVLYSTPCTTQCSTCDRFGYHLYLITCLRVCYHCYIGRVEYFPVTIGIAAKLYASNDAPESRLPINRRQLRALNLPSALGLPGYYCSAYRSDSENGIRVPKRRLLFDRRAMVPDSVRSDLENTSREPQRFVTIIMAPYFLDNGHEADWGRFCLGCLHESDRKTCHFRFKYTKIGLAQHLAKYGPVKESLKSPGRFMHTESS